MIRREPRNSTIHDPECDAENKGATRRNVKRFRHAAHSAHAFDRFKYTVDTRSLHARCMHGVG
jgi:hypothetical protein